MRVWISCVENKCLYLLLLSGGGVLVFSARSCSGSFCCCKNFVSAVVKQTFKFLNWKSAFNEGGVDHTNLHTYATNFQTTKYYNVFFMLPLKGLYFKHINHSFVNVCTACLKKTKKQDLPQFSRLFMWVTLWHIKQMFTIFRIMPKEYFRKQVLWHFWISLRICEHFWLQKTKVIFRVSCHSNLFVT